MMAKFSGSEDPKAWLKTYTNSLDTAGIPISMRHVYFSRNLDGLAHKWYIEDVKYTDKLYWEKLCAAFKGKWTLPHSALATLDSPDNNAAEEIYHLTTIPKSMKTHNIPKKPQLQHQQQPSPSSVPPLPSPATTMNNGPQPPVPTVPATDFALFLQRASPEDLELFLELASTTQEGRNLELMWHQAYMEGVKKGINEAKSTITQQLQNANVDGFREGYDEGRNGVEELIQHYENRIEIALHDEWSRWKGHGNACFELPVSPLTCESAVQSDPVCPPVVRDCQG